MDDTPELLPMGGAEKSADETSPLEPMGGTSSLTSSATGAARHQFLANAFPGAASYVGMGLGGAAGTAAGPVGTFLGAAAGGMGASYAARAVQDKLLDALPYSVSKALGIDPIQLAQDEGQHSTAAFVGGMLPGMVGFSPMLAKTATETGSAFERLLGTRALLQRGMNAAFSGGFEAAGQAYEHYQTGSDVDWTKVSVAAGVGAAFSGGTYGWSKYLEELGTPAARAANILGAKPASAVLTPEDLKTSQASPEGSDLLAKNAELTQQINKALIQTPMQDMGITPQDLAPQLGDFQDYTSLWNNYTPEEQSIRGSVAASQPQLMPKQTTTDLVAQSIDPEAFNENAGLKENSANFKNWLDELKQKQSEEGSSPEIEAGINRLQAASDKASSRLEELEPRIKEIYQQAADRQAVVDLFSPDSDKPLLQDIAKQLDPQTISAYGDLTAQRDQLGETLRQLGAWQEAAPSEASGEAAQDLMTKYRDLNSKMQEMVPDIRDVYQRAQIQQERNGQLLADGEAPIENSGEMSAQEFADMKALRKITNYYRTDVTPEVQEAAKAYAPKEFLSYDALTRQKQSLAARLEKVELLENAAPEEILAPLRAEIAEANSRVDNAREELQAANSEGRNIDEQLAIKQELAEAVREVKDLTQDFKLKGGEEADKAEIAADALTARRDALLENMSDSEQAEAKEVFAAKDAKAAEAEANRVANMRARQTGLNTRLDFIRPQLEEAYRQGEVAVKADEARVEAGLPPEAIEPRPPQVPATAEAPLGTTKPPQEVSDKLIADLSNHVETQLKAAGRPEALAKTEAALATAHANAWADLYGVTPEEFFEDHGFQAGEGTSADAVKEAKTFLQAKGTERGSLTPVENSQNLLNLTKDQDASTVVHELGHQYLVELTKLGAEDSAPQLVKDLYNSVARQFQVSDLKDLSVPQHEQFAKWHEQYLREGVAPSNGLAEVFAQFKVWLTKVYQTITSLGEPLPEAMKDVFDKIYTSKPVRTVIKPEDLPSVKLHEIHSVEALTTPPHQSDKIGDAIKGEVDSVIANNLPPEIVDAIYAGTTDESLRRQAAIEQFERAREQPQTDGRPTSSGKGAAGEHEVGTSAPGKSSGSLDDDVERLKRQDGDISDAFQSARSSSEDAYGNSAPPPGETSSVRDPKAPIIDGSNTSANWPRGKDGEILLGNVIATNLPTDLRGIKDTKDFYAVIDSMYQQSPELHSARFNEVTYREQQRVKDAAHLLSKAMVDMYKAYGALNKGYSSKTYKNYMESVARFKFFYRERSMLAASAGRALAAFHKMSYVPRLNMEGDLREQMEKHFGITSFKQMAELAEFINKDISSPDQLGEFLEANFTPLTEKLKRAVVWQRNSGLLSGPLTHLAYIAAAAHERLMVPTYTVIAALQSKFQPSLSPQERTYFREAWEQVKAHYTATPAAITQALRTVKTGVPQRIFGEQGTIFSNPSEGAYSELSLGMENPAAELAGHHRELAVRDAIASGLKGEELKAAINKIKTAPETAPETFARYYGNVMNVPARIITGIHTFNKLVGYQMQLAGLATKQAMAEGLSGYQLTDRISELRLNPPDEMAVLAAKRGNEMALNNRAEWGSLTQRFSSAVSKNFGLSLIFPFVQVEANLVRQGIERSVFGLALKDVRGAAFGQSAEADLVRGKMIAGTFYTMGVLGLAAQGKITGGCPEGEESQWRALGKVPYSLQMPTPFGPFNVPMTKYLGGFAKPFMLAADLFQMYDHIGQEDMQKSLERVVHSLGELTIDDTWVGGLANLFEAIDSPFDAGKRYATNLAAGFMPFSSLLNQVAHIQEIDPYQRKVDGLRETVQSRTPFWSTELPPRLDIFGEPLPNKMMLTPLAPRQDRVWTELERLDAIPAQPQKSFNSIPLLPTEYQYYSEKAGKAAKLNITQLVNSPGWVKLNSEQQQNRLRQAFNAARAAARTSTILLSRQTDHNLQTLIKARQAHLAANK